MVLVVQYLRLIKYPGSKFTIIPVIQEIFQASGCGFLVDVFGGSGSVLLNVSSNMPVYNDINSELVNVFTIIKNKPLEFKSVLARKISLLLNAKSENKACNKRIVSDLILQNIEDAVSYVISFSISFGGMGKTYSTVKEKAYKAYLKRTLETFDMISKKVSGWTIHNMDFRELISRYDKPGTFFYFDPPYPGKVWYNYNFGETDFVDLAKQMKMMRGKYLLTLNSEDESLSDIFGNPTFIRSYENENGRKRPDAKKFRYRAFYTNVKR